MTRLPREETAEHLPTGEFLCWSPGGMLLKRHAREIQADLLMIESEPYYRKQLSWFGVKFVLSLLIKGYSNKEGRSYL